MRERISPGRNFSPFQLTEVEDKGSWQRFMADLKVRGLLSKNLKLILTEGNPGILEALKGIYPFIKGQRCIAHKMRNLPVKVRKANQTHFLSEAKLIFAAGNRKKAIKRYKAKEARWLVEEERAVQCMQKDQAQQSGWCSL
jgi:transposase-like protein